MSGGVGAGVEYAQSSLLLPAAVGLANLTRLPTCVPELPLGLLMCEHGAGLSRGVSVLRALNHLVSLTVGCHVSQVLPTLCALERTPTSAPHARVARKTQFHPTHPSVRSQRWPPRTVASCPPS